jgi:signal peptidase I
VTKRPAFRHLLEIVETLILTLIIFVIVQNFVAQPYQVEGRSMEHTFEPGQFVLVDKVTPRFSPYKRGDVVVFKPPTDLQGNGTPFIKRVIGEAGDRVEIRADGLVYVNDQALSEPYLFSGQAGEGAEPTIVSLDQAAWTIPAGEVFLMGDHRTDSADSRVFGPVRVDRIIGRAWLRYWPADTFGVVASPIYANLGSTPP